jgi:hypothetical protein
MSRLYTAMMIQDVDHRQHELHKCAQWEVLAVSDKEDEEDRRLSLPVIAAHEQCMQLRTLYNVVY